MPRPVKYAVVLRLENDQWHGCLPEFPLITSSGRSQEQVILDIGCQLQAAIDGLKRAGLFLPPAKTRVAYVTALERGAYEIIPC